MIETYMSVYALLFIVSRSIIILLFQTMLNVQIKGCKSKNINRSLLHPPGVQGRLQLVI